MNSVIMRVRIDYNHGWSDRYIHECVNIRILRKKKAVMFDFIECGKLTTLGWHQEDIKDFQVEYVEATK